MIFVLMVIVICGFGLTIVAVNARGRRLFAPQIVRRDDPLQLEQALFIRDLVLRDTIVPQLDEEQRSRALALTTEFFGGRRGLQQTHDDKKEK